MKKYALALIWFAIAGYGSLSFAAESAIVVLDEVPESVKEMNKLSPEEQTKQDEVNKAAVDAFNAAAEATTQENLRK